MSDYRDLISQRYVALAELAVLKAIDSRFPYEGVAAPGSESEGTFIEFQEAMLRQIAAATGMTPVQHARLSGGKVCLSCGAIQPYLGTLPCDH